MNDTKDAVIVAPETAVAKQTTQTSDLISKAIESGAGIDVIEKLTALMTTERNDWRRQEFNAAMAHAQAEMLPISADATNPQTHSKYASYSRLDSRLRPIYTAYGFGLSFSTEPVSAEEVRVICIVSHSRGYERKYGIDMPADGKGPKGNAVMTKTHATGSATSYGMRYLLKMIFNVAVGEFDDDGNKASLQTISLEQSEQLTQLIKDAEFSDSRLKGMLTWAGCDDVSHMPVKKFEQVLSKIQKEIATKKDVESCM